MIFIENITYLHSFSKINIIPSLEYKEVRKQMCNNKIRISVRNYPGATSQEHILGGQVCVPVTRISVGSDQYRSVELPPTPQLGTTMFQVGGPLDSVPNTKYNLLLMDTVLTFLKN